MRVLLFIALVAFVQVAYGLEKGLPLHSQLRQSRAFESQVNATLECLRNVIKNGRNNLPPLDPLDIVNLDLDLDELTSGIVKGKVNLKNGKSTGLGGWEVTHLKGSITIIPVGGKFEVNAVWPEVVVEGEYSGELTALEHNVKGSGHLKAVVKNVEAEAKIQISLGKLAIKKLSIGASVGDVDFKIDNLQIDGEDKSEEINEFVNGLPEFIKEHQAELNEKISNAVIKLFNENGELVQELIEILQSVCK